MRANCMRTIPTRSVHTRFEMETKVKKSWHKPKVADYGHVSKLTAGNHWLAYRQGALVE
jgi:hypothetical protein